MLFCMQFSKDFWDLQNWKNELLKEEQDYFLVVFVVNFYEAAKLITNEMHRGLQYWVTVLLSKKPA